MEAKKISKYAVKPTAQEECGGFVIKKIEEEDIEKICRIEKQVFPDAWSAAGIRESFVQPYTMFLGAWLSDEFVGYLIFYFAADEGEVVRIAVDAKYRRRGAALRLLEEIEKICRERNIRKIMLDVRESNEAAAKLYKNFGFAEDGRRKSYYSNPAEDAVLMSRVIGK